MKKGLTTRTAESHLFHIEWVEAGPRYFNDPVTLCIEHCEPFKESDRKESFELTFEELAMLKYAIETVLQEM